MQTQDELMEMTKPNLINLGESFKPALALTMDDKKGDMVRKIVAAGETKVAAPVAVDSSRTEGKNARGLPKHGRLFDLQGNAWEGKFYQLKVFATEIAKGPVEVTVNGWLIRFKRGVMVVLPEPYVDVLKKAVVSYKVKDADTGEERNIEIQQFPMQIEGVVEGPTRVIAA